jgi:nitroreductase
MAVTELPSWAGTARSVDAALRSRKAIRAFLPTPISAEMVSDILEVAARSPSGTNTQPWRVRAVSGEVKHKLSSAIQARLDDPHADIAQSAREPHYPARWPSPFLERRRKVGWDLYGLLGIRREDRHLIDAQRNRNFRFYDAPVGLLFTIDAGLKQGSWLDYGMFLQSIMLAARARGLSTCPQAAFTQFSDLIADLMDFGPGEVLVCGMALGHADPDARVNTLETVREPVDTFASFHGFDSA